MPFSRFSRMRSRTRAMSASRSIGLSVVTAPKCNGRDAPLRLRAQHPSRHGLCFLRFVAGRAHDESRDSVSDIWGPRTPHQGGSWAERVDSRLLDEPERWVQSACVLCSNGCALDIGVKGGRMVGVRGRAVDRVNRGRLGPKGLHGWIANHSEDRLRTPLVKRDGRHVPISWDEAMDLLVRKARETKERYTPGAIGFYNTGQLLLEEYYTLAILGDAGIGTAHMDGNTRLCTATAAMSLIESFGTDGQPGSYTDFDVTDCIFMIGHNMASTQTVLWSRVLDRLASADRPRLIVVDPRRTEPAKHADLHLAPRLGTNLALMNGLLHLVIRAGAVDRSFVDAHTTGYEELEATVSTYSPEHVSEITGVAVRELEQAGEILSKTPSLVSTVLQGVYQSMHATATACQVNNLHLIRGLIGKPGSAPFQMNGQPTAQNTRECGANGELVAFRNWNNTQHLKELADIWNVRRETLPHWAPPTHAMEIFRHCETGSIRFLWIICTNPAVSLPELARIRRIVGKEDLFVVAQDAFFTETAQLADLVLPAAIWGEKTGTFTNVDRTVHISYKAVDPPGEARSDLDIFVDFAKRMDFRDKDGKPLVKWSKPEEAFEAFKKVTKGRPCDYTGITYAKLTGRSGIQWPCNEEHPNGTERLYTDGRFNTDADYCELYGHDLATGAQVEREEYLAHDPGGRARIKPAEWSPPTETPDEAYPFYLTTGRVTHQFHTRTKTARSPELNAAAPDAFVQMAEDDAARLGVTDGDLVEVESRRGTVRAPARVGDIVPGHVFVPFHYGYWDEKEGDHRRAANELTMTGWDPVSKQPHFKFAAVRVRKVAG
jgi:ferredoxin-nitrate reductase